MPFPQFHSARLAEPNFERYAYKKNLLDKGVDVIFGFKNGTSTIQSIRFDKDKFSESEAKEWLKNRPKYRVIKFEPAKIEEDFATSSGDIATFANRVGPVMTRYKKTIRSVLNKE